LLTNVTAFMIKPVSLSSFSKVVNTNASYYEYFNITEVQLNAEGHCQIYAVLMTGDWKLLAAMVFVTWHITPCSPLKVNRRFGLIYHLHHQG
jgi:fucose 4-O-acetylase-like acetyltransferase